MSSDQKPSPSSFDLRNIVLLVFVTGVAFCAGEFVLRSLTVTDRLGFNQMPSLPERVSQAAGTRQVPVRIVGIGDSFTVFRDQQGHNYLRYAQALADRTGTPFDLVNLAEAGTDLHAYFRNLARYQSVLKPDIVTIGLYLGNDVGRPVASSLENRFRQGELMQPDVPAQPGMRDILVGLAKKSVLLNYTYRQLKVHLPFLQSGLFDSLVVYLKSGEGLSEDQVQAKLARTDPQMLALAKADAINAWDLASALFQPRLFVDLYEARAGSDRDRNLTEMLEDLDFTLTWIRTHGMRPVVVLLHPGVIVSPAYQDYYRRLGYELPDTTRQPLPLIARISEFLSDRQIPYLDSLAALRAAQGNLYIPNDMHLNSEGQRVVGEALFRLLQDRNLLPES